MTNRWALLFVVTLRGSAARQPPNSSSAPSPSISAFAAKDQYDRAIEDFDHAVQRNSNDTRAFGEDTNRVAGRTGNHDEQTNRHFKRRHRCHPLFQTKICRSA
jgi:hypothetical protein